MTPIGIGMAIGKSQALPGGGGGGGGGGDPAPTSDDFIGHATSALPSTWKTGILYGDVTEPLYAWTVAKDVASPTGRKLTMPDRNSSNVQAVWWQPDGAQISIADGDVLVCLKWNDDVRSGVYLRASAMTEDDGVSTEGSLGTGIWVGFYEISNQLWLRLTEESVTFDPATHIQFPITTPQAGSSSFSGDVVGDYWWIRVNFNGATIQARAWKDGTDEPGTWDVSHTASNTSAGALGLVFSNNAAINEQAIAYFSYSDDPAVPAGVDAGAATVVEHYVHPVAGVASEDIPWPSNPSAGDRVYWLISKDNSTVAEPSGWTTIAVNEAATGMTYRLVVKELDGTETGTFSYTPGGAAQWRCAWLHVSGEHSLLGAHVEEGGFVSTQSWGTSYAPGTAGAALHALLLGAAESRSYVGLAPANADQTFLATSREFCSMYVGEYSADDPLAPGSVAMGGQTYHHGATIALGTVYSASSSTAHPSSE